MVVRHQQKTTSQQLLTDPDCAPESDKSVSTSRTGSNVCALRGSYSRGKSFFYFFLGFIAVLIS